MAVTVLPTNQPAEEPPLVLSGQTTVTVPRGVNADFLVADIPFILAPSPENPYTRQFANEQKQMFDNSHEAGEQTFGDFWRRAQSTFHGGQFQKWLDTADPNVSRTRFWASQGVDVHVPGEATICGAITKTTAATSKILQATWNGQQVLVQLSNTANTITVSNLPDGSSAATYTIGTAGIGADMTTDGSVIWVAINDQIWRVVPGVGGPTITQTHAIALSGPVVISYVNTRLLLAIGRTIYNLDSNPTSPPHTVTSSDVFYNNPSTTYTYTAIRYGARGIFLTGYSGLQSDLSLVTVTVDNTLGVQLAAPTQQFQPPPGEILYDILFYVSGFFILASTQGARVGTFTFYGQPVPGALLIRQPCYSLAASGTLVYVGSQDSVWVIDLSTENDQFGTYSHYQYANGLGVTGSDYVRWVTVLPGNSAVTVPDVVVGLTHAGDLLTQPWWTPNQTAFLTTSWMRYDTTEVKRLYYLDVDGTFPAVLGVACVCCVTVETQSGTSQVFHIPGGSTHYQFGLTAIPADQAFRITFNPHDTGAGNDVAFRSWQLKARPAEQLFGTITLPFFCQDFEIDYTGSQNGYPGYARARLSLLEALVGTNQLVTVKDVRANTSFQATVEQAQFQQTQVPTVQSAIGGIVNVQFRLV